MSIDFIEPADWSYPIPIHYGPGRINEVACVCSGAGINRPLIVTDRGSRDLPFIHQLMQLLPGAGFFWDISPNPTDREIFAGAELFRQGGFDGIVAVGGGSGMDGGKAIGLIALNELDLWSFEFEQTSPNVAAFPPLITIPTTSGTGAETESTAMVSHSQRLMKFCVWHPNFHPSATILDPELTLGLPPNLTAWTGMDAITHAIEAYSVPGLNPLCDGAALQGLHLCAQNLPRVMTDPQNLNARGAMLVGSCMAGIAFSKGLGHVHAISHMIGAEFDTQHGLTNAIVLPSVLRFNAPVLGNKACELARQVGATSQNFDGLYRWTCEILDDLVIPKSLSDIGIPTECVDRIADKARVDSAAGTNPRPASKSEMLDLVKDAILNGR